MRPLSICFCLLQEYPENINFDTLKNEAKTIRLDLTEKIHESIQDISRMLKITKKEDFVFCTKFKNHLTFLNTSKSFSEQGVVPTCIIAVFPLSKLLDVKIENFASRNPIKGWFTKNSKTATKVTPEKKRFITLFDHLLFYSKDEKGTPQGNFFYFIHIIYLIFKFIFYFYFIFYFIFIFHFLFLFI